MPMDWEGNGPPFQAWGEVIQGVVSLASQFPVPVTIAAIVAVGVAYLLTRRRG